MRAAAVASQSIRMSSSSFVARQFFVPFCCQRSRRRLSYANTVAHHVEEYQGEEKANNTTQCSSLLTPMEHLPGTNILDVSSLADRMRSEVRAYTSRLPEDQPLKLVGVLPGVCDHNTNGALLYSERIAATLQQDRIVYQCCTVTPPEWDNNSADDATVVSLIEAEIQRQNACDNVHGILVFYPIFGQKKQSEHRAPYLDESTGVHYKTWDDYVRDCVAPGKDVEGLRHIRGGGALVRARRRDRLASSLSTTEVYVPCTALAVMKILEACNDQYTNFLAQADAKGQKRWTGSTVTIVNRSEIVGRPLAALLAQQGATVYSVDESSVIKFHSGGKMSRCANQSLEDCLGQSTIVVTGVPSPDFRLPLENILPNATIVNVAGHLNVSFIDLITDRRDITLVPQVGKVTVAALAQNLVRLHRRALPEKREHSGF